MYTLNIFRVLRLCGSTYLRVEFQDKSSQVMKYLFETETQLAPQKITSGSEFKYNSLISCTSVYVVSEQCADDTKYLSHYT